MNHFEAKKQRRIESYKRQEEKNLKIYRENSNAFSEENSGIPLGQPIHSVRDRNYRDKLARKVERGFEALEKAGYYKEKAEAAERNHAIFSDDPEAIRKVKQEIADLTQEKERSTRYNKKLSKYKTKTEALKAFENSTDEDEAFLKKHLEETYMQGQDKIFWFCFHTSSLQRKIRTLKKRLLYLESRKKLPPINFTFGEITGQEVDGQIRITFPGKPSEEVRSVLKRYPHSLKYSRFSVAWVRKLTPTTDGAWLRNLKSYLDGVKDSWAG